MGIGYISVFKNAVKMSELLMPLLVICGLLLLWVLIVVVCLFLGQGLDMPLNGNVLIH